MIFEYEGRDITDQVSVNRCEYEAWELRRPPSLVMEFGNAAGNWESWSPKVGDCITVSEPGVFATGRMYVERITSSSGDFGIRATALPKPDAPASRTWANTTLCAVGAQMADMLGLSFAAHGVEDMAFACVRQDDEGALSALARIAVLAGCTFDIYDSALHLCSRSWVEAQDASGTIELGDGSRYAYERKRRYSSCMIEQEPVDGVCAGFTEAAGSGEPRLTKKIGRRVAIADSAGLRRACAGLLAHANAAREGGYTYGGELSPFTPGSTCNVIHGSRPSVSGKAVVTRVRNDFAVNASKTWWRLL